MTGRATTPANAPRAQTDADADDAGAAGRVLGVRTVATRPSDSCAWHSHAFEELCLCGDDGTAAGQARRRIDTAPGTLFYHPRGVPHGHWNSPRQSPRFLVLHFTASRGLRARLPFLERPAGAHWTLTGAQAAVFRHLHMRIFLEHARGGRHAGEAKEAWLRLLLIEVERFDADPAAHAGAVALAPMRPELARLWQLVADSVPIAGPLGDRLERALPNYDSLRHAFTASFGVTPGRLLLELRMREARRLLLETTLSVKEVAAQVGYGHQHEFARAFRKQVGASPSAWRTDPDRAAGSVEDRGRGGGERYPRAVSPVVADAALRT